MTTWRRRAFLLALRHFLRNPLAMIFAFAVEFLFLVASMAMLQRVFLRGSVVIAARETWAWLSGVMPW